MALRYNINLDQGSDYTLTWPVVKADGTAQSLVGWSASMQVRTSADADDFLVDMAGRLTLSGSSVILTVPGTVSNDWEWRHGFYDLEVTSPEGFVTRVSEGRFTVNAQITR